MQENTPKNVQKMRIVVTLVTSLLPQLLVFQVVLQGGNGCKGKKLYVGISIARVHYYYFTIKT